MFPIVETEFRPQSDFLSDTPLQAYNVEKAEINVRMKIQESLPGFRRRSIGKPLRAAGDSVITIVRGSQRLNVPTAYPYPLKNGI